MINPAKVLLFAVGLALVPTLCTAQTADAPHPARKAAKVRKATRSTPAPLAGSINAPSTDFSKIERADEEPKGRNGPTFRPTMGAGGMGLGTGF